MLETPTLQGIYRSTTSTPSLVKIEFLGTELHKKCLYPPKFLMEGGKHQKGQGQYKPCSTKSNSQRISVVESVDEGDS